MASVSERFPYMRPEDAVRTKDWAAGSSEVTEHTQYIVRADGRCELATVQYAPSWEKTIDEPIVNALDQAVRAGDVRNIRITFDVGTGAVAVRNDGQGIEIALHEVMTAEFGRPIYLPTMFFGFLHQGSNHKKPRGCITGGTNGLGAKIANCHAHEFTVDTVYKGQRFVQTWRDGMSKEEPPQITPATSRTGYTELQFQPNYSNYRRLSGETWEPLSRAELDEMCDIVRTRAYLAAIYAALHKCTVWFNGQRVDITTADRLAALIAPGATVFSTTITPTAGDDSEYTYPWEISVAIAPNVGPWVSIVNGIVVGRGRHITKIEGELVKPILEKLQKDVGGQINITADQVLSQLCAVLVTKVPDPKWTGQRKDVLGTDIRKFAGYTLPAAFVAKIYAAVKPVLMDLIAGKRPKKSGKDDGFEYKKIDEALWAGTKHKDKTMILLTEGDSAKNQTSVYIRDLFGAETHAIMSLSGVIPNVRREVTVTETARGTIYAESNMLRNNIIIRALKKYIGLRTDYKYDLTSPSYAAEMRELRYGCIVAVVDQDLDGMGNILSLVVSMIEFYWPALIEAGFVQWFATPIIRAYPRANSGGRVIEFYDPVVYEEWRRADPKEAAIYDIKYYKGLGTHSKAEARSMFSRLATRRKTYYLDEESPRLFHIYLGNEPDLRKAELSKPTVPLTAEERREREVDMRISCSSHLRYETNLYQKDNLERKLDNFVDGQTQAGRKILDGLLQYLRGGVKSPRVSQMGGYISESRDYHHGEASLYGSITSRGYIFTGGKQLPVLCPDSFFGSRLEGGADAASPRYIHAHLNYRLTDLLFPADAYHLLEFNYDGDDKRIEPKYFIPILPLAVLESTELPAHGWKLQTWGRDVFGVIRAVRLMINGYSRIPSLSPATYKGAPYEWKGRFVSVKGVLYSLGIYELGYTDSGAQTIIITELPLRVWDNDYAEMLSKKRKSTDGIIANVVPMPSQWNAKFVVELMPGALERLVDSPSGIPGVDGICEYFKLRRAMHSHLNMMCPDNYVREFGSYEEIVHAWFPYCRDMYIARSERVRAILEVRIRYHANLVRYVTENPPVQRKPRAEQVRILEDAGYDKIHKQTVTSPGFIPTADIAPTAFGDKASYAYLLRLNDSDKSDEGCAELVDKLDALRHEMYMLDVAAEGERFPGAYTWLRELDALEAVIREGLSTAWTYGDDSKFSYDEDSAPAIAAKKPTAARGRGRGGRGVRK